MLERERERERERVFNIFFLLRGTSQREAVLLFLRHASSLDFYGMTCYEVQVSYSVFILA